MAQVAGELEIRMFAELSRLRKDMEEATKVVTRSTKNMEGAVESLQKAFGILGMSIGVLSFASLIKGSIDAMDKLNDLSKTTAITVENLAGLELAAKQSGGNLESIADSINKLSQNMGKEAEKFKQLGISAQDPLEAFKQLSDIFVALENPQQRAAIAAAALGKSWAGAAPLLAEGSEKIQEMVDKGRQLAGVTKEMAEEADKFNDQLVELKTTGEGLLRSTIGPMLPAMNRIAEATREATKEHNIFTATVVANWAIIFELLNGGGKAAALAPNPTRDGMDKKALASIFAEEKARKFLDQQAGKRDGMDNEAINKIIEDERNVAAAVAQMWGQAEETIIQQEAKALSDRFKMVELAEQMEIELEQGMTLERMENLKAAYDARNAALIEAYDRDQEAAIENGRIQIEIEEQIAANQKAVSSQRFSQAQTFFGSMSKLMDTNSKRMFKIGKAAAMAETAVNTYAAAMGAYKSLSSIPYVGPALGAAAAAAITLAGAANISKISGMEIGGGAAVGTFQASPQTGLALSGGGGGGGQQGSGQTTIINLTGETFSRKMIRDLLEGLNENSVDGSRVIVSER